MSAKSPAMAQKALGEARQWLGTPYQHQASLRGAGCDCLGLVRGVWRALYGAEPFTVPPYAMHWAETGRTDALLHAAQRYLLTLDVENAGAGDVLLFRFSPRHVAKHCAIQSAPGRMIHAYWGQCVSETALTPWWRRRLAAAFRFPD